MEYDHDYHDNTDGEDGNTVNSTSSIKVKVYQGSTGSADGGEVDQSGNYWATIGDLA